MADKITFTKDDPIKVNIKPEKSIKISNKTPFKINTNVSDIDSIPNYKKYEKERQDNELERIANENERKSNELERQDNESSRQAYIDNLKQRVLSGEFKGETGDKGEKGDNNTLDIGTVEQGTTASATITGESPNQTLNLVLPKGDKGEKGNTGVWVGNTTPTDDSNVWIDPQGTPSTVPTKLSDLEDDSTHRTVTDVEKNNWNNKLSEVPNTYKTKNENDLLYQPKGEYITKAVNDLTNYYLKSDTYTKSEVNNLISAIQSVSIQIVQTLPQTGDSNKIYFVPKQGSTYDVYDEYVFINNNPEHIGNTEVDLSNYYNKAEIDTMIGNIETLLEEI